MSDTATKAREVAEAWLASDPEPRAIRSGKPERWYALGDPQTSFEQVLAVLGHHGLVGEDGWLRADVGLVSMGDHFDYALGKNPSDEVLARASREGISILSWLAAHPHEQVVILFGNHDAARVQELAGVNDAAFVRARQVAAAVARKELSEADFLEQCPGIPTSDLARRDFCTFSTAQQRLVQRLLLGGRFRLAMVATVLGRAALLTHAGVTARELGLVGLPEAATASDIDPVLNHCLGAAVEVVRADWEANRAAPLSLEPLHIAGQPPDEAGGMLAHRPADPNRSGGNRAVDTVWEFRADRPRRFDPFTLPMGLVQVVGHTRHKSSLRELGRWATPAAREARGAMLRTLRVWDGGAEYDVGCSEARPNEAVFIMVDADINGAAPETVPLLRIGS
jgi:hypothetical protein